MSDHRWQGYTHQELFEQIHQGPGAEGSRAAVQRWTKLADELGTIDAGLAQALSKQQADWEGRASDQAQDGVRPLGNWAAAAQLAAHTMRDCAREQERLVTKARGDMPQPVAEHNEKPSEEVAKLAHLFGFQTDFEPNEARRDAAEKRAFEVMLDYESSSRTNTASLASFAPPSPVVVDSPAAASGQPGTAAPPRPVTLSWGATPPTAMPGPNASAQPAAARGGTHPMLRSVPASGSPSASAASNRPMSPRRGETETDQDTVDQTVTEESESTGGIFTDQRITSRPVIGE